VRGQQTRSSYLEDDSKNEEIKIKFGGGGWKLHTCGRWRIIRRRGCTRSSNRKFSLNAERTNVVRIVQGLDQLWLNGRREQEEEDERESLAEEEASIVSDRERVATARMVDRDESTSVVRIFLFPTTFLYNIPNYPPADDLSCLLWWWCLLPLLDRRSRRRSSAVALAQGTNNENRGWNS